MRYGAVMNGLSEPNGCIESLHLIKGLVICVSESMMLESDFSRLINIIGCLVLCVEERGVLGIERAI